MPDPTPDRDPKVVVHLHVRESDRNTLRAIAALSGVGVSELVASWTAKYAKKLGLPAVAAVEVPCE